MSMFIRYGQEQRCLFIHAKNNQWIICKFLSKKTNVLSKSTEYFSAMLLFYLNVPVICFLQNSECPQRLVSCPYCDLELAFSQSKEHEDYCGTRTEPCPLCKCNVMLREQVVHPALCGSLTPPQEKNNSRMSRTAAERESSDAWFEAHSIRNLLRPQERSPKNNNIGASAQQSFPPAFNPSMFNTARETQASRDWKNAAPQNTGFSHCECNVCFMCREMRPSTLCLEHLI